MARQRVSGKSRAEFLKSRRGPYLPQTTRAAVVSLRIQGWSYHRIAKKVGCSVESVMLICHEPETERKLAEASEKILSNCRQQVLQLVPEATQQLERLISTGDRQAILQTLFGSRTFVPKTESAVDLTERKDGGSERSPEQRLYHALHGHWPTDPCNCAAQKGGK
jgi:hypothetical protein